MDADLRMAKMRVLVAEREERDVRQSGLVKAHRDKMRQCEERAEQWSEKAKAHSVLIEKHAEAHRKAMVRIEGELAALQEA
jgi:hypothetical protein